MNADSSGGDGSDGGVDSDSSEAAGGGSDSSVNADSSGGDGSDGGFDSGGPDAGSGSDSSVNADSSGGDGSDGGFDSGGPDAGSGSDSSGGTVGDAGAGTSCNGLPATCGASRNTSCCSSSVVPGGTYNRSNDATYPATVSDFRLDTYEITVGRFRKFGAAYSQSMIPTGAGKDPNDPIDPGWNTAWNAILPADANGLIACDATYQTWTGSAGSNENLPMNCIDWYVSFAFCVWDGGRLPTEAEWNYAAAGGNEQRQYPWGATVPTANADLAVYSCYFNSTGVCTGVTNIAPVGSVTAGNGKWGQSDLAGNVYEWTLDSFASPYTQIPCSNCANTSVASNRVLRGGSYSTNGSSLLTSSRSSYYGPANNYSDVGARCARTP